MIIASASLTYVPKGMAPMMHNLPDKFDTTRGLMRYSIMDTGDRYVEFAIDPDDFDLAMNGRIGGMIVPADVSKRHLDQVLGEIRDSGGVRFVVLPRSQQS